MRATNAHERIKVIEAFLLNVLENESYIISLVRTTVDTIFSTKGKDSIKLTLKDELKKRRQLERKFLKYIGMSPKKLSKVVRLQSALKMMLNSQKEKLSAIAYSSNFYDQAHFIKDFKELSRVTPGEFFEDETMILSSHLYR